MTAAERARGAAAEAAGGLLALPLYPVLIAAYFPLHLMSENLALFPAAQVIRPVVVVAAGGLLLVALLWALARDRHRAGLWAALALGFTLFFIPLQRLFDTATRTLLDVSLSGNVRFAVLLALFALVGLLVRPGPVFTRAANIAIAVMLALPLVGLAGSALGQREAIAAADAQAESERAALFGAARAGTAAPSLLHIVLDGYSRADVLRELYDFDNTPFLDALRARGFAVADQAVTPYNQTLLVMTGMLSAQYLPAAAFGDDPAAAEVRKALKRRFQASPVLRTLDELGYQTAATDVEYDPIRIDRVDRVFSPGAASLSNFEKAAYHRTALAHLLRQIVDNGTGQHIKATFKRPHHRDLEPPFFLYMHIIAPHPPLDVDRYGNPVRNALSKTLADGADLVRENPAMRRAYRDGYLEKLRFANARVLAYLDRFLAEAPDPKLVILHGDHGGAQHLDQEEPANTCFRERYSPLVAVYSSDGRLQQALPPDVNLVNLYRILFNLYFETELPLLPSRSFYARWSRPSELQPVPAEQLRRPCEPDPTAAAAAGRASAPPQP